jgi:hypothetical protein
MLNDALLGFKTIAETAAEKSLVVWINEYFGPVARDGKTFDQMQVYFDNREKVLTSVGIPHRPPDTFGENIRRMREMKLTFKQAAGMAPGFWLVEKQRLCMVRRDLFEQTRTRRLREVNYGKCCCGNSRTRRYRRTGRTIVDREGHALRLGLPQAHSVHQGRPSPAVRSR